MSFHSANSIMRTRGYHKDMMDHAMCPTININLSDRFQVLSSWRARGSLCGSLTELYRNSILMFARVLSQYKQGLTRVIQISMEYVCKGPLDRVQWTLISLNIKKESDIFFYSLTIWTKDTMLTWIKYYEERLNEKGRSS